MTFDRTCILCTPRSGSQLCEKLLQQTQLEKYIHFGEYFEKWNQSTYIIENNIVKQHIYQNKRNDYGIDESFKTRLSSLKSLQQPISLRLFCLYSYDIKTLQYIIDELRSFNFKFLVLTRNNKKEQLLSWLIARSYTDTFKHNVFGANSKLDNKVYIDIQKYRNTIGNFVLTYRYWETMMQELLPTLEIKKVIYESIYHDMKLHYGIEFTTIGEKTIDKSYNEYVQNYDEVNQHLDKFLA